jgi:hypothetical protein
LNELHQILEDEEFCTENNFVLIKSFKDKREYSSPYTMVSLDYDVVDVIDRLKELSLENYSETLFDKDDDNPPLLFVFGKTIQGKEVYIKLKIKESMIKKVLCISFHFAQYKMKYPYA